MPKKKNSAIDFKIKQDEKKSGEKKTHRLDLNVSLVGLDDDDGLSLGDLVSGLLQPRDDLRERNSVKERKRELKKRREVRKKEEEEGRGRGRAFFSFERLSALFLPTKARAAIGRERPPDRKRSSSSLLLRSSRTCSLPLGRRSRSTSTSCAEESS